MLPNNERPCSPDERKSLLDYLNSCGDNLYGRINAGEFDLLIGDVAPLDRVACVRHCWLDVPGPIEKIEKGASYIKVGEARTLFQLKNNLEWDDHEYKIKSMLNTLKTGRQLPGKIVIWDAQPTHLPGWVIIVGNHTTQALYRYAIETKQELTLPVYRAVRGPSAI